LLQNRPQFTDINNKSAIPTAPEDPYNGITDTVVKHIGIMHLAAWLFMGSTFVVKLVFHKRLNVISTSQARIPPDP